MTRKIFWEDPYRASHSACVTSVDGPVVRLDSTIFFAFSGGQESDTGTIAGFPVVRAEVVGGDIAYTLPADHGLSVGDPVTVEIDWDRRYRLMRLHFAAELVLETVYQRFAGVEKIGAHIAEGKARLDFRLDESISPYLSEISRKVGVLIQGNLPITSAFEDESEGRRYWEIEGFAHVPCGGTHLKRSGEVGAITLKRNNIGKGKERIEISLDE